MIKEKMTLTEALAEQKTLDKRIEKLISESTFIAVINEKTSAISAADTADKIKAGFQKVTDLMERRDAMKRAIVMANAKTELAVAGQKYTIAEAIDAKNHRMVLRSKLLNALANQANDAHMSYTRATQKIEQDAMNLVKTANGGILDSSANVKDLDIYKQYIEANKISLVDPLGLSDLMTKMLDEIDDFTLHVDTALAVTNAGTIIEFSYGEPDPVDTSADVETTVAE